MLRRLLPHPLVVAAAVLTAAVAGGVTAVLLPATAPAAQPPGAAVGSGMEGAGATPAPPVPIASLRLATNTKGKAPYDQPLELRAESATLTAVSAQEVGGASVAGTVTDTGWRSAATLVPSSSYRVRATYVDLAGVSVTKDLAVTASDPKATLTAVLSPGDDDVVGVGQPVTITLSRDVPQAQRSLVTKRLSVQTAPRQTGAWRWTSSRELHWRPKAYWKQDTTVRVASDLTRLDLGGGTWGRGTHTTTFRVGERHVSTADVAAHTLTVRSGGKVVRVIPISAGNREFPTRSGVHLALEKHPSLVFDSSTIGIPNGGAGGYKKSVEWDVRLTYSGTFVHAAPWSAKSQGRDNVSHGCLNASPADAKWFYDFTRRGDVVEIINSGVPPLPSDPGSLDWNMSFAQWTS